jgi:hypothetical protein
MLSWRSASCPALLTAVTLLKVTVLPLLPQFTSVCLLMCIHVIVIGGTSSDIAEGYQIVVRPLYEWC